MKEKLLQGDCDRAGAELKSSVATLQDLSDTLDDLMRGISNGGEMPPLDEIGQLPVFA